MEERFAIGLVIIALVVAFGSFLYIGLDTDQDIIIGSYDNITETHLVEINSLGFSPSTLTIEKGDKVKWINLDDEKHEIVNDETENKVIGDLFNSPQLETDELYTHTFNQTGTFDYHCDLNPSIQGKIIIK